MLRYDKSLTSSANGDLVKILRLAQQGSTAALGELLEGCRQYLLLVASQQLHPELAAKTGASDVVQDTFMHAQRRFKHFKGSTEADLLRWLRRILRNHLTSLERQYLKAEKRRVGREISLDGDRRQTIINELTARDGSPSRHAMRGEQAQALYKALNRLPERYRQVIEMRHCEQLAYDQIADGLELSVAAARQLWFRAIMRLRRELKAC